jgi:glycosyltransferase involved in cell wall biosynthesis
MIKNPTIKKLISICIPVLNEEQNIEILYSELNSLAEQLENKYNFEFIFTDNNSSDLTWHLIKNIRKSDLRIRGFRFTRNIGFQQSIYFNYMQAKGDAIVQIDADLQDPPRIVIDFLNGWENGFKVVVGVRRERHENFFLRKFRQFGYSFLSKVARFRITKNAGDFRLIDREVVEILRKSNNPEPYLRGAIAGLGFPEKEIIYDRRTRNAGKSKIGLNALIKLGFTSIVNYSNLLSRIAVIIFVVAFLFSIAGVISFYVSKITSTPGYLPPGFTTIAILLLMSIGINSLFFAIIIHYLQRLHLISANNEPIVVLEKI